MTKISDISPLIGNYNFGSEKANGSEDEIISVSALRKLVKKEIQQMMTKELEVLVIRIINSTIGLIMEDLIRKTFKEQIELALKRFLISDQRNSESEIRCSQPRSLTLQFRNELSLPILTGKDIKGNGCTSIELALVDAVSGQVVMSGPEAYSCVEIVVLKENEGEGDNWTSEEFNNSIVRETKGKKSLLTGNVVLRLNKGVGVVGNIKFAHSSTWMTQGIFKLGARVTDSFNGIHIKEAKTESFIVKDRRNDYYKKHEFPALSDEVWRLKNIAKDKKTHKRLQEKQIHTVRDFLCLLFKDPEGLKDIAELKSKNWEATVQHARTCMIDKRMSCYIDHQQNKGVVFNLVDEVLGIIIGSQYISLDNLSDADKADAHNLAVYALENWNDVVVSFDDDASLLRNLSPLCASVNPIVSQEPDHPRGHGIEASDMAGEYPFEGISTSINFAEDPLTSATHFGSISISDFELMDISLVEHNSSSVSGHRTLLGNIDDCHRESFQSNNHNGRLENHEESDQEIAGCETLIGNVDDYHIETFPSNNYNGQLENQETSDQEIALIGNIDDSCGECFPSDNYNGQFENHEDQEIVGQETLIDSIDDCHRENFPSNNYNGEVESPEVSYQEIAVAGLSADRSQVWRNWVVLINVLRWRKKVITRENLHVCKRQRVL